MRYVLGGLRKSLLANVSRVGRAAGDLNRPGIPGSYSTPQRHNPGAVESPSDVTLLLDRASPEPDPQLRMEVESPSLASRVGDTTRPPDEAVPVVDPSTQDRQNSSFFGGREPWDTLNRFQGPNDRAPRNPVKQFMDDRMRDQPELAKNIQPLMDLGVGAASLAGGLAIPAALTIPALTSGAEAADQYGEAGGMTAGVGSVTGGATGAILGQMAARGLVGRRNVGLRTGLGVLGALGGGAVGSAAAGGVNNVAQSLVNKYDAGERGGLADVGGALDALGYRSMRDVENAAMERASTSPQARLIEAAREKQALDQRAALVEQMWLQSLMS